MWRLLVFMWFVLGANGASLELSARSVGRKLQHCLSGKQVWHCLGVEGEHFVELATQDNSTWQLSEYLSIEPEQKKESIGEGDMQRGRSLQGLAGKLLELAQGRALRMRFPRQLTISNAIDDFGLDQGTIAHIIDDKVDKIIPGFGNEFEVHATATDTFTDKDKDKQKKKKKKDKDKDKDKKKKKKKKDKYKKKKKKTKKKKKKGKEKYKKKNKKKNCFNKTGRKKKDKDKNMAMMGGMIMLATFAQMFLGKVILIAGSAFIMAKIALLISLLGSLKKGSTGSSGSGPEHVIVTNGGGGHSHESGWHRSMPTHGYTSAQLEGASEASSPGHEQAYYAYEAENLKRSTSTNREEPRRSFF